MRILSGRGMKGHSGARAFYPLMELFAGGCTLAGELGSVNARKGPHARLLADSPAKYAGPVMSHGSVGEAAVLFRALGRTKVPRMRRLGFASRASFFAALLLSC